MDSRWQAMQDWLAVVLKGESFTCEPASADASFRRYFRVGFAAQTRIVMDAPPDKEDSRPFVRIAGLLQQMGLNVPAVLQADFERGFFLLSDLGATPYLAVLNAETMPALYHDALTALTTLQRDGRREQHSLPPYDHRLLCNEMQLFRDWYLLRHLGVSLSSAQQRCLDDTWEYLAAQALQQERVFVHRDYHSRNLMYSDGFYGANPGILDFQDAVEGPITYDLVSLLRDCYIDWPRSQVEALVSEQHARLREAGLLHDVSRDQFIAWFDGMGIQRHLKASGIFARLNYRDAKPGYLQDIPRTLTYVLEVAADYPALRPFIRLLQALQIPAALQQTSRARPVL